MVYLMEIGVPANNKRQTNSKWVSSDGCSYGGEWGDVTITAFFEQVRRTIANCKLNCKTHLCKVWLCGMAVVKCIMIWNCASGTWETYKANFYYFSTFFWCNNSIHDSAQLLQNTVIELIFIFYSQLASNIERRWMALYYWVRA